MEKGCKGCRYIGNLKNWGRKCYIDKVCIDNNKYEEKKCNNCEHGYPCNLNCYNYDNWKPKPKQKACFENEKEMDDFMNEVFLIRGCNHDADYHSIYTSSKAMIKERIKSKGYIKQSKLEYAKEEFYTLIKKEHVHRYVNLLEKEIEMLKEV